MAAAPGSAMVSTYPIFLATSGINMIPSISLITLCMKATALA